MHLNGFGHRGRVTGVYLKGEDLQGGSHHYPAAFGYLSGVLKDDGEYEQVSENCSPIPTYWADDIRCTYLLQSSRPTRHLPQQDGHCFHV